MSQPQVFQDILTRTVISTSLWDAYDRIGFDGAKVTADDAPVLGPAKHPNTVIGDPGAVMVIGTAQAKAVGVITAGARLVSAVGGVRVFDPEEDTNPFAIALTTAANGQLVTYLLSR